MNCGKELIYDEEQEVGLCDRCYEERLKQEMDERKHPDDNDNLKRKG